MTKKIQLTEAQLREMISTVVRRKLTEDVGAPTSTNPIMAKREVIALMEATARSFEKEIIKTFSLQDPDGLTPDLQRRYLEIVEEMKTKMVEAAMSAVRELVLFPKTDEGNGAMK